MEFCIIDMLELKCGLQTLKFAYYHYITIRQEDNINCSLISKYKFKLYFYIFFC